MSALGLGAIDATPLSQRILVRVRDRILAGALAPNRWQRIADLAAELGTSVTPVRTALLTLEQQGLVEVAKARGFRAIPPTRRDVTDAYLITAFLSGELTARAAALRGTQTPLAHCETVHEAMIAVADGARPGDVDELNWGFHRAIHVAAESPRAASTLRAVTRSVPHAFHRLVPGWTEVALVHHREILDALRSHDPEKGRRAAERHVLLGCEMLLEHFERSGYWS